MTFIEQLNYKISLATLDLQDLVTRMSDFLDFRYNFTNDQSIETKFAKVFTIFERDNKLRFRLDYCNSISYEIPEFDQLLLPGTYYVNVKSEWVKENFIETTSELIKLKLGRFDKFELLKDVKFDYLILSHLEILIDHENVRRSVFFDSKKKYVKTIKEQKIIKEKEVDVKPDN